MSLPLPKYIDNKFNHLRPHLFRALIFTGCSLFTAPSIASAQSQKTDIRPHANQVLKEGIINAFEDKTHHGSYNFNSNGLARNNYVETHKADGRVQYSEGEINSDGAWFVRGDNLCFAYQHPDMNGGCFRVYQVKNCFYYYSANIPQDPDELGQDYWVARSTLAGQTPDCDPALS